MGNASMTPSLTKNWQKLSNNLYQNVITQQLITKHEIQISNDQIDSTTAILRRRVNNQHMNVPKLIYFTIDTQQNKICQLSRNTVKLQLYTEYLPVTLHEYLQKNQFGQCFCHVFLQSIILLVQRYGYFAIDDTMVFITDKQTANKLKIISLKVWINSEPHQTHPEKPCSEYQMSQKIIILLKKMRCEKSSEISNHLMNLQEINNYVSNHHHLQVNKNMNKNKVDSPLKRIQTISTTDKTNSNPFYCPSFTQSPSFQKIINTPIQNKQQLPQNSPISPIKIININTPKKQQIYQSFNSNTQKQTPKNYKVNFSYQSPICKKTETYDIDYKLHIRKKSNSGNIPTHSNIIPQTFKANSNYNFVTQSVEDQISDQISAEKPNSAANSIITPLRKHSEQEAKSKQNNKQSVNSSKNRSYQQEYQIPIIQFNLKHQSSNKAQVNTSRTPPDPKNSIKSISSILSSLKDSPKKKDATREAVDKKSKEMSENYNKYLQKFKQVRQNISKQSSKLESARDNIFEVQEINLERRALKNVGGVMSSRDSKKVQENKNKSESIKYGDARQAKSVYNESSLSSEDNHKINIIHRIEKTQQILHENKKKIEKIQLNKDLQREKELIRLEMEGLLKTNSAIDDAKRIKEKVKAKNATFAQLKAEASKILEDLNF